MFLRKGMSSTTMIPRTEKLSFCLETAFKLGCHSDLSYEVNVDDAKVTLEKWGFSKSIFIDGSNLERFTDTQAYVASSATVIVVAFRGSQANVKDWVGTDVQMIRKPLPWLPEGVTTGEAHSGFIDAISQKSAKGDVSSILDQISDAIDKFQPENGAQKHVFVTGHSLGGALATLTAMYLRGILMSPKIQPPKEGRSGVEVIRERRAMGLTVYTFGSPRVMDDVLALAYDRELRDKTFRLVHNNDVVTQLPPYGWGYTHIGSRIFLLSDGTIENDPAMSERDLGGFKSKFDPFELARILMGGAGGALDHFLGAGPLTNDGPFPGWIDLFLKNGGYLGAIAKGIIRYGQEERVVEPVTSKVVKLV